MGKKCKNILIFSVLKYLACQSNPSLVSTYLGVCSSEMQIRHCNILIRAGQDVVVNLILFSMLSNLTLLSVLLAMINFSSGRF